jgi:hypothetical protein
MNTNLNHKVLRMLSLESIRKITSSITNWDDLWIAYAISSLEIEVKLFNNISNLELLSYYLSQEGIVLDHNFSIEAIDTLALKIASLWKENYIPLPGVSDRILYIRDLIYLKLIYNKITHEPNDIV